MTRRGTASGKIESYTKQDADGAIVCQACSRIIVSKENLEHDKFCPYCHNDVNIVLADTEIIEDDDEIIAKPC